MQISGHFWGSATVREPTPTTTTELPLISGMKSHLKFCLHPFSKEGREWFHLKMGGWRVGEYIRKSRKCLSEKKPSKRRGKVSTALRYLISLLSDRQPISQTVRGTSIYDVLAVGEGDWSKGTDRLHECNSECQREQGSKNLKNVSDVLDGSPQRDHP